MIRTILLALALSGCAVSVQPPIVDTKGVDPKQYATDLAECGELANQAKRQPGISEVMGVNEAMHHATVRMCLVHRGYKVVG